MKNKKLFAILTLVCFMLTLMPVAAFADAGDAKADVSYFTALDGDQTVTVKKASEGIKFVANILDADENATTASSLYVWAKDADGTVSSAMGIAGAAPTGVDDVLVLSDVADGQEVTVTFSRSGEYTVYAGLAKVNATVDSLSKINAFGSPSKIKVTSSSADPDYYQADAGDGFKAIDSVIKTISGVKPNNVMGNKVTVKFIDKENGKALKGKTVTITTNSSSIETSKTSAVTNSLGQIDFEVSASVEGSYEIEVAIDGVSWTVKVEVGNTNAAYITTVTQPTAPQALYGDIEDEVEFAITDINGNTVTDFDGGMTGIEDNTDGKYVVLTQKPAASNIESESLNIEPETDKDGVKTGVWILTGLSSMDAEGTYTVKVILDNGAYATATWEVKRFQTPVKLIIGTSTDVVELGGSIGGELKYVDANGVMKAASDAKVAATGYAVAGISGDQKFSLSAKSDEKYVGATITLTAVSEKYDLVATKDFKVAEGATDIAFVTKTAEVNVNNKIEWNVVDSNGTRIALGTNFVKADIKYVVLDKPEGAKVSTSDKTSMQDLKNKGIGQMALTSNKVGNVTVQAVVKATYSANGGTQQIKYYTGTQIFAVGNDSVGDVVVMSIGSNEIIVNDAKATIDAAPIVQNDRTYVPFRALAEAFGAEVAYDEATQAVTAELNGVTVVMTIGSATYTVNGAEKTMDVAPFINGSRTMVPVRFVAEAFGIKVIPTYDENGATADILFNL